jgi:hypothetical protein
MSGPPDIIALDHDDYHACHVGRLADGRQFFLTFPFIPALDDHPGREFIALYLFDSAGCLQDARIEDLGTRAALDEGRARGRVQALLAELGQVEHCRIEVAPFQIERFGTSFGLVARPPEDEDDGWWVELQPGNYMAFHEPWDSGEYDT